MSNIQLKVSPDQLRQKAEQIAQHTANAQKSWQRLCELASLAKHYWEGDAADFAGRLFEETRQEAEDAFRRLREHPVRLMQMAGVYIEAEQQAAQLVKSLPDDVIL